MALSREQRIVAARLSSTAARYAAGRGEDDDPVAALRAISPDPKLLGHAAAVHLVRAEQRPADQHAPRALAYLRAAGAAEATLAAEAQRVRHRAAQPPHTAP